MDQINAQGWASLLLRFTVFYNLILGIFNLIPLFPLMVRKWRSASRRGI